MLNPSAIAGRRLERKTALVTGASRGIGFAIAKPFIGLYKKALKLAARLLSVLS